MPKRKRYPRGSSRKSVRHDWALRSECRHEWRTVIHGRQRREWLYCLKCNLFFVKELEAGEGETSA